MPPHIQFPKVDNSTTLLFLSPRRNVYHKVKLRLRKDNICLITLLSPKINTEIHIMPKIKLLYLEMKPHQSKLVFGSSFLVDLELKSLVIVDGGKPKNPRAEKSLEEGEIQQRTPPTYGSVSE